MKLPTLFVNHGGGPLPLLGRQPQLADHLKNVVQTHLSKYNKPETIVLVSAHWESDPIRITSNPAPSMLYDYYGFPPETYEYQYPAPGAPGVAQRIHELLTKAGVKSELDSERGFDHGVFVPLMLMYPDADIPVVCVSLHKNLDAATHWKIGSALQTLREENILILGSGYTFHNMQAFQHPTPVSHKASRDFNLWLKDSILHKEDVALLTWEKAPGARVAHPREEHLLPLWVIAAAAGNERQPEVIYDTTTENGDHAVTGYLFH